MVTATPQRAGAGVPGRRRESTVAAPEPDVVRVLFAEHRLGLVRMAVLLVDDRETAQDVVQEAFLQVHARRGSLPSSEAALAYVRRCVLNGARTVLRRRRTARRAAVTEVAEAPMAPGADAAVLSALQQAAVVQAVRALPTRQQQVVILRFWLDLTAGQAAEVLGVRPTAVAAATFKAMRTLGRLLSDQGFGVDG